MGITVLRLGHRIVRDQRITTHVALTARAFGAERIIISGKKDDEIIDGIERVCGEFGGMFEAEYAAEWRSIVKNWKGIVIHLTMYGIDIDDVKEELKSICRKNNVLVIVGGAKVPPEVYEWADYNIAIGNQPHSEVAALAILLDRLVGKNGVRNRFEGGKKRIMPAKKGKEVMEKF